MQPQQLFLLVRPAAGALRRWCRRGRVDPEPCGAAAYRLWGAPQPLCGVLQRGPTGSQMRQAQVVLAAPAAGVSCQTELAGAGGHASRAAVPQMAGDLSAAERAGVAIADQGVLPIGPAATRAWSVDAELLGVQTHSVGCATELAGQPREIAAVGQAESNRLVLVRPVRARRRPRRGQHAATRPDLLRRAMKTSGEDRRGQTGGRARQQQRVLSRRPRRRPAARSDSERLAAQSDSERLAACNDGVWRAAEPAAMCFDGTQSAYRRRSDRSSALLQRLATTHLKQPAGPGDLMVRRVGQRISRGAPAVKGGIQLDEPLPFLGHLILGVDCVHGQASTQASQSMHSSGSM